MKTSALFFLGALAGTFAFLLLLTPKGVGIPINEPSFSSQTTSQVTCSASNASTSVLAAKIRNSVVIENRGANIVHICRGSSACSATSSFIALTPLSSSSSALTRFVQQDNYTGPYVCRAETSDTVINVSSAP